MRREPNYEEWDRLGYDFIESHDDDYTFCSKDSIEGDSTFVYADYNGDIPIFTKENLCLATDDNGEWTVKATLLEFTEEEKKLIEKERE